MRVIGHFWAWIAATSATFAALAFAPRAAMALCEQPTDPDCVALRQSYSGVVDFFATGAAFTVNNEPGEDRPNGLRTILVDGVEVIGSEVVVPERRIPARARLVQAFLYFGGSLFQDNDGNDTWDLDVEIQVPGSDHFVRTEADRDDQGNVIGLYHSDVPPPFTDAQLYVVRSDITALMKEAGGQMVGTYRVRGFNADIFRDSPPDEHGNCSPGVNYNAATGTCEVRHTVANASFSVVLIFEEDRLPPRKIVLFDGLQAVLGSTMTLSLSDFRVSQVPSGQITIYAQEGDCNPGPGDCANGNNLSGTERIRVIGANPDRKLVLSDSINPPNDIFNRTINTVDPPLTNVAGTDIDRFDISPILRTDDDHASVEITTPVPDAFGHSGELVGIVYVVVGIDTFLPRFDEDSRIDIRSDRGEKLDAYYPGDPLRVAYALSNTGNLPGTGVQLSTDIPENVVEFQVVKEPVGSVVEVEEGGGAFGKGQIRVSGISARHGEVDDLVVLMVPECPLADPDTFKVSAIVGAAAEGGSPFSMTSSVALLPRSICGPRFYLYGGGGCAASAPLEESSASARHGRWAPIIALLPLTLLGAGFFFVRSSAAKRPRARGTKTWRDRLGLFTVLMFVGATSLGATSLTGCGEPAPEADRPAPYPIGEGCPGSDDMVQVPSIRGLPAFCIDRYEASIAEEELGRLGSTDGADTTARALSARFAKPTQGLTWFQARAACANASKRLCTAEEWTRACRGEADLTYPYGDAYQPETCNGYDAIRQNTVETGAMLVGVPNAEGTVEAYGCVSPLGVYDLSGNVSEWNETDYLEGSRRGLAGGSYRSNRIGLRCVTEDNYAPPSTVDESFGFRCCL